MTGLRSDRRTATGYWLVTAGGEVVPFGDAGDLRTAPRLRSKKITMVGIARTA